MKHYLSAVFLFLSIILAIMSVSGTTDRKRISDMQISEEDLSVLTENRTETERNLLDKISINDFPLLYDEPNARWFYTMPDTQEADFKASFTSDEKNVNIAFSGGLLPGNTIQMIAYTDAEYKLYSLAVTTLPLILIECESTAIPSYPYMPMTFTLYDNSDSARQLKITSRGTIHVRGNFSSHYPKKPFRISLTTQTVGKEQKENDISLLGLRQDGDWLLYGAYNDQEKIRNVFSSNLWFNSCADDNGFGFKYGNEYRYAELFIDHQYWGLYAIGFPIDAKQMGIIPETNGHYEDFIFKQRRWGPADREYATPDEILYLQFEADDADRNYGVYLMELFFEQFKSDIPYGLDNVEEKNAIDIWLFTKLIQDRDSIGREKEIHDFFYTIKQTDEGRKILYTPWDMDASWGNGITVDISSDRHQYAIAPDDNTYEMAINPITVMHRSGIDSQIAIKIKTRYEELRSDSWSDRTVDKMLDGFEKDIYGSGAYVRDMERWPEGKYQDPASGLSHFRTYVHERFASMDVYIEELGK